jgi:hypothetical protein
VSLVGVLIVLLLLLLLEHGAVDDSGTVLEVAHSLATSLVDMQVVVENHMALHYRSDRVKLMPMTIASDHRDSVTTVVNQALLLLESRVVAIEVDTGEGLMMMTTSMEHLGELEKLVLVLVLLLMDTVADDDSMDHQNVVVDVMHIHHESRQNMVSCWTWTTVVVVNSVRCSNPHRCCCCCCCCCCRCYLDHTLDEPMELKMEWMSMVVVHT